MNDNLLMMESNQELLDNNLSINEVIIKNFNIVNKYILNTIVNYNFN